MVIDTLMDILYFALGVGVGAGIMYGFEEYQDWKEEKENKKVHFSSANKKVHFNSRKEVK